MSDRIPPHLYPSDFPKYFSMRYQDIKQVFDRDIAPRIVLADNGRYYELQAIYNQWGQRVVKVKLAKKPK